MMKLIKTTAAIAALTLVALVQPALAQETATPPPEPCQDGEFRQMDFWLGHWDLTWTAPDGTEAKGKNSITLMPYGDCVITERFDGGETIPLDGMSVSVYSKPHKLWRQTWVDNQGGYFALTGGPQEDGTFVLNMDRIDENTPYSRMVFEGITEDSLVWRWQGKREDADDWADQWVIHYKRQS